MGGLLVTSDIVKQEPVCLGPCPLLCVTNVTFYPTMASIPTSILTSVCEAVKQVHAGEIHTAIKEKQHLVHSSNLVQKVTESSEIKCLVT